MGISGTGRGRPGLVYGRSVRPFARVRPLLVALTVAACGAAPEPPPSAPAAESAPATAPQRADLPDPCAPQSGKPAPAPLERSYTGVAARARCEPELYGIMEGVARSLGVECSYCHLVPDFRAMTPKKEIANWMASELTPALRKKGGGQVGCSDCHNGVAKILGEPRKESFAIEWMTTHLVEDFETKRGSALHCKSCHLANLGAPEFQRKVSLTHHLPTD